MQEAQGGAGVYSADMRKMWQLEDDSWKYDIMPEIMDGRNVADFVDPDIEAQLAQLEKEEDALAAAAALEVNLPSLYCKPGMTAVHQGSSTRHNHCSSTMYHLRAKGSTSKSECHQGASGTAASVCWLALLLVFQSARSVQACSCQACHSVSICSSPLLYMFKIQVQWSGTCL